MTVVEAIQEITREHGPDIFRSTTKFCAILKDYVTEAKDGRNKKLFIVSCQNGILSYAEKFLQTENIDEIKEIAFSAKSRLESNAFMDKDAAKRSINILLEGLNISFKIQGDSYLNFSEDNSDENKILTPEIESNNYSLKKSIGSLKSNANNGDVGSMLLLGDLYSHKAPYYVDEDIDIALFYYNYAKETGTEQEKQIAKRRIIDLKNTRLR